MPSATTAVGSAARAAAALQRLGQAAVHEQRRVDAVREVAQLLHRVLEVVADLLEHLLRGVGIGVGELARQVHVHGQRDEVLLRAVVEVALDGTALRVARFDDARARGAQLVGLAPNLVERLLERRVELHVVQREPHLARELGERLVVGLAELQRALRPAHDDQAEQLAGVGDRRDPKHLVVLAGQDRGQPDPRPRRARHAGARDHGLLFGSERRAVRVRARAPTPRARGRRCRASTPRRPRAASSSSATPRAGAAARRAGARA